MRYSKKYAKQLKAGGFRYSPNSQDYFMSDADLEKAKQVISTCNKIEYVVTQMEELEQLAARKDKTGELSGLISGYIDSLASETDAKVASDELRRYLNFFAKFHQYSANNKMLIYIQRPDATKVGSMKRWGETNRSIKKGAKGIKIFVPIFKNEDKLEVDDPDDYRIGGLRPSAFRIGTVFDVSDTVATSDEGNIPDVPVWWANQDPSETCDELFELVQTAASTDNIKITVSDAKGGEHGYSAGGHINLTSDIIGAGRVSTMVHEYAHELMHWPKSKFYIGDKIRKDKELVELQAESVAYLVLKHYDIDVSHNTTYLALWRANSETIKKSADIIGNVAQYIIKKIYGIVEGEPTQE